jgi:hypothetical protein
MALSEQEEFELLSLERERANGGDVGSRTGDKRRMTDQQRLELLKTQRSDPDRNPTFDSELEREIARISKTIGSAPPAPAAAPAAPRPSPADVRAIDAPGPLADQEAREAAFQKAILDWTKATGGVLKPGQNTRQAAAEWSGLEDPEGRRAQAETDHLAAGGDFSDVAGNSLQYQGGKVLAAMGGGALAGPGGATTAEGIVRLTSIVYNLKRAIDAGSISEDDAAGIVLREMAKGVGEDALFNFGVPLVGQIIAKIPGAQRFGDAIIKRLGMQTGPTGRAADLKARADLSTDPARRQAVAELGKRTKDAIPTPGQVTGESGLWEDTLRLANPRTFQRQQTELTNGAVDLAQDTLYPATQPEAKAMGQYILDSTKRVKDAVAARLRPTFDAADNLGVSVNFSQVGDEIEQMLRASDQVYGGKLATNEREMLMGVLQEIRANPNTSAKAALDFISRQKETLRSNFKETAPSDFYDTVISKVTKAAEGAYVQAAQRAGKPDVVRNLLAARKDYKEMMGTIYEDAIKKALAKNPEDLGRHFWQAGNVSEIEQLQRMLTIGQREGTMSAGEAKKLSVSMARGFLQESVKDLQSAANWSEIVRSDPVKKRTWETLMKTPGAAGLAEQMKVLEAAAQMALKNGAGAGQIIPLSRAAKGGAGYSMVTGGFHPLIFTAGLSTAGVMHMAAHAMTHGDTGISNMLLRTLRASGVGTPAAAKAIQEAYPKLKEYADKAGIELFVEKEQQE